MSKEIDLIEILKNSPMEPFSLDLTIASEDNSIEELFDKIKDIFINGLIINSGLDINSMKNNEEDITINLNDIDLKKFNSDHIELMKKHMLSMGIEVIYKKNTKVMIDSLFRDLLFDIEKIKNLDIKVILDWRTNLIDSINLQINLKANDLAPLNEYTQILSEHYEANHFLKLGKKIKLHDFAILLNEEEDIISLVYFDFAKRDNLIQKSNIGEKLIVKAKNSKTKDEYIFDFKTINTIGELRTEIANREGKISGQLIILIYRGIILKNDKDTITMVCKNGLINGEIDIIYMIRNPLAKSSNI